MRRLTAIVRLWMKLSLVAAEKKRKIPPTPTIGTASLARVTLQSTGGRAEGGDVLTVSVGASGEEDDRREGAENFLITLVSMSFSDERNQENLPRFSR